MKSRIREGSSLGVLGFCRFIVAGSQQEKKFENDFGVEALWAVWICRCGAVADGKDGGQKTTAITMTASIPSGRFCGNLDFFSWYRDAGGQHKVPAAASLAGVGLRPVVNAKPRLWWYIRYGALPVCLTCVSAKRQILCAVAAQRQT
ncbi:hypothetical protein B0T21DRAFT_347632 [Apiosordaria backusii]|uniref:Uncharacterized protein n=1 Tax=Apiosordaria backusii TaxID=314023 RepID=A0AA40BN07_9PEZI|nr:hypothetical protein B0T21DRAFT_347632 [Apiosordaria backusii]